MGLFCGPRVQQRIWPDHAEFDRRIAFPNFFGAEYSGPLVVAMSGDRAAQTRNTTAGAARAGVVHGRERGTHGRHHDESEPAWSTSVPSVAAVFANSTDVVRSSRRVPVRADLSRRRLAQVFRVAENAGARQIVSETLDHTVDVRRENVPPKFLVGDVEDTGLHNRQTRVLSRTIPDNLVK